MSVDLPEPDGPMMATYSPLPTVKVTPRSAWISSLPITYVRQRSVAEMIASWGGMTGAALIGTLLERTTFYDRPSNPRLIVKRRSTAPIRFKTPMLRYVNDLS